MKKQDSKKIAADIFDRYKKENIVYVCSDGQSFFNEAYAKTHAVRNDLEYDTIRRSKEEDVDIESLDRVGLTAFIADNGLNVNYDEKTTDEDLREAIIKPIAEAKPKAKAKITKKSK